MSLYSHSIPSMLYGWLIVPVNDSLRGRQSGCSGGTQLLLVWRNIYPENPSEPFNVHSPELQGVGVSDGANFARVVCRTS